MKNASQPIRMNLAKSKNQGAAVEPDQRVARPIAETVGFLPPICNMPLPRNPYFTGRKSTLSKLRADFDADRHTVSTQVVKGLGGIGKTQIALEFAYRYASDYQAIWWVRAEDPDFLSSDYASFATALNLPEKKNKRPEIIISGVNRWLEKNRDWLLILDNVKKPKDISGYLPRNTSGNILITSRHQVWEKWCRSLTIEFWPRNESVKFVTRRIKGSSLSDAALIAEALSDLPLALEQAGACIDAAGIACAAYLTLFKAQHRELWENEDPPVNYPDTIGTTASLALEKLKVESPASAWILNLCSFLGSNDIPLDVIRGASKHVSEELSTFFSDPEILNSAINALTQYALAEKRQERLYIHHLIQSVIRDRLTSAEQKLWSSVAVRAVNTVFPDALVPNTDYQSEVSRLIYNGRAAIEHAGSYGIAPDISADLLDKIGVYLQGCGRLSEAEPYFHRAIKKFESHLGTSHPDVAAVVNNLATLYRDQNRYSDAEPLLRRTLALTEKQLISDHPDVAASLNNLAVLLHDQGKNAEAEPLLQRALEISASQFGNDHLSVASNAGNLGLLLHDQGRYAKAESSMRHALRIIETQLGADHPQTATSLNNLAVLLNDQGKYADAEPLLQRALEINDLRMGSDHLETAVSLMNLAVVFQDQGKFADAEPLFRRALKIREEKLGADHPDVAISLRQLAELFHDQGRLDDAKPLYQRAIKIQEAKVEMKGGDFATSLNNLALLYHELGQYTEAEPLFRRALDIKEKQLGTGHPDVAVSLNNLAFLYHELGQYTEAEPLFRRALEIREKQLGSDHPDVATSIVNLSELLKKQAQAEAADALLNRIPTYYSQKLEP
jgi:tetratricopeptide (TPR) repeat protein